MIWLLNTIQILMIVGGLFWGVNYSLALREEEDPKEKKVLFALSIGAIWIAAMSILWMIHASS